MPSKPLKPCSKQGCSHLTRERYCESHKQLNNQYDQNRGTAAQRGYGSRWRRARQGYLSKHPVCVRCGDVASVVDHITPHKGDMHLFWLVSNWQSLCTSCHLSAIIFIPFLTPNYPNELLISYILFHSRKRYKP